jgi:hypothetical protein
MRTVEAIALDQRRTTGGRLGGEIDHVGPLPGEEQDGQPVLDAHERQLAPPRKRPHERLGPEVLVDVDHRIRINLAIVDQLYEL